MLGYKYKAALFVFFPFRKELPISPSWAVESVAQKQQLPMRRQLANTFHSLFAEGNVLHLLTFQIASESKQVSLSFFSF